MELGLITKDSDEYKYLISFIKLEMKTDLHIYVLDGENLNLAYKTLNIDKQVDQDEFGELDFWSTTQTFQVGGWFFDVLNYLYQGYLSTDQTMSELTKASYELSLIHI